VSVSGRAGRFPLVRRSQADPRYAATALAPRSTEAAALVGPRRRRTAVAVLLGLGLLLVTGACGRGAQTLQPYTPAEGVNFDVGNRADPKSVVHVRNLLIISKAPGQGILSATIVTNGRDELTGVTGNAIKSDGSAGAPFTATLTNTVSFANGAPIVLTDGSPIVLRSADLAPGLTANVTLQFRNAGQATALVTVVDGNEPQFSSISPSAEPSA
jgi:hypothetical protein